MVQLAAAGRSSPGGFGMSFQKPPTIRDVAFGPAPTVLVFRSCTVAGHGPSDAKSFSELFGSPLCVIPIKDSPYLS